MYAFQALTKTPPPIPLCQRFSMEDARAEIATLRKALAERDAALLAKNEQLESAASRICLLEQQLVKEQDGRVSAAGHGRPTTPSSMHQHGGRHASSSEPPPKPKPAARGSNMERTASDELNLSRSPSQISIALAAARRTGSSRSEEVLNVPADRHRSTPNKRVVSVDLCQESTHFLPSPSRCHNFPLDDRAWPTVP